MKEEVAAFFFVCLLVFCMSIGVRKEEWLNREGVQEMMNVKRGEKAMDQREGRGNKIKSERSRRRSG